MGIFYHPPPPAGRTAVTPPEPHVPIGTQGSAPPRYSTAVMLVAVLAAWPPDLEPRLARPNEQRQTIAPLTLTYGQAPTPQGPLTTLEYGSVVAAWPSDLDPRLSRPNAQRQTIAPLTLTYGTQPQPTAALAGGELIPIVATWTQTWDAQTAPRSTAWNTPLVPFLPYARPQAQVWTAWVDPPLAPPPLVTIAPLTLVYGTPPQPQAPLSTLELAQIVSTWAQPWDAQNAPKSAAWNVPPVVAPLVAWTPLPGLIWTAWIEPFMRPPGLVTLAPVTLPTGDAPPPRAPLSASQVTQLAATWVQIWDAQAGARTMGWYIAPIPPPPSAAPRLILVDGRLAIHLSGLMYEWVT